MSDTPHLKCSCQNCGAHIEFPADGLGAVIDCPHCGKDTTLSSDQAGASKPKIKLLVSASILLAIVLMAVGALVWPKMRTPAPRTTTNTSAQPKPAPQPPPEPVPAETVIDHFRIGKITVEKAESGGIFYAVGTVKNDSEHQRFGVKIVLDEFDKADHKLGSASDYIGVIEPFKDWRFRALLTDPKTVTVKLAGIGEKK